MYRPNDDLRPNPGSSNDRSVAIALALSILICLATFVWIFIEIEPFMSDFTGNDVVVTPAADDPFASPVEATATP